LLFKSREASKALHKEMEKKKKKKMQSFKREKTENDLK
jgi:hypothetical protein